MISALCCEPGEEDSWATDEQITEMQRLYVEVINETGADVTFPELVLCLLEGHLSDLRGEGAALRGVEG